MFMSLALFSLPLAVKRSVVLLLCGAVLASVGLSKERVEIRRLPDGGVQPQVVVDSEGVVHAVYLAGERKQADVYYIRSTDWGASFSEPLRVNSQPGSAVASGTIRGAQLAVGAGGLVHVAWNGSTAAQPRGPLNPEMPADSPHNGVPLLYSRLAEDGVFEPQRNLMKKTFGLDGGGSVAADANGNVYVAWHGKAHDAAEGEAGRRVWLTKSSDNGETFSEERGVFDEPTGACGCCAMRLFADSGGNVLALYRSAREIVHRDIYLLRSEDGAATFDGKLLHPWEIGACPMSSMFLLQGVDGVLAAWETDQQVYFASIEPGSLNSSTPIAPPGEADYRKHPVLAQNHQGRTLLVWSSVKGWGKPGELYWQRFDASGNSDGAPVRGGEIPPWSLAAAFATPNGGFVVLY